MNKTFRSLSMAALVLMGAVMTGCSSEDNIDNLQQPENKSNVVTLTTTVGFDEGTTTRALAADGKKTFVEGDKITVVYMNTSNETVKAVSNALKSTDITNSGKSAQFTVTLTNPDNTKAIRYIYPAAMAKATVSTDATIDDAGTVDFTKLNSQNGSLTTLGSSLDLCTFDAANWASGTLPNGTLENKLAILACTLKNSDGSSTITGNITSLTISDGTNAYVVSGHDSDGHIYVAIRPTSSSVITVTATDGTNIYTKSLTGKAYAASNGYSVSWRMTQKAENVVSLTWIGSHSYNYSHSYTAQTGDVLTGVATDYVDPADDTKDTSADIEIRIADGAIVTLRNMTLDGSLYDSSHAGITCEGDATIILKGTNSVTGFHSGYPGISVPAGKTLTIQGDGSLTVRSNGAAAGIGGGGGACGNIVINSGTITAYGYTNYEGSTWGAGIGGCQADCGDITINGGTVTAYGGGGGGAGIGSGNQFACGNITINRGTVTATGGDDAAGIGGGIWGSCGNITIANTITSVSATKGNNTSSDYNKYTDAFSIGIGGDYKFYLDGMNCACGTITFDTQSFTPEKHLGDADHDNSWTYSPEPVSGTSYGGLTLTISDKTWTLVP